MNTFDKKLWLVPVIAGAFLFAGCAGEATSSGDSKVVEGHAVGNRAPDFSFAPAIEANDSAVPAKPVARIKSLRFIMKSPSSQTIRSPPNAVRPLYSLDSSKKVKSFRNHSCHGGRRRCLLASKLFGNIGRRGAGDPLVWRCISFGTIVG